jgi:hypothetical protein
MEGFTGINRNKISWADRVSVEKNRVIPTKNNRQKHFIEEVKYFPIGSLFARVFAMVKQRYNLRALPLFILN